MEKRIKYVKINGKGWYYVLQVKKWLFWKTINKFVKLEDVDEFLNKLKKVDDFNNKSLSKVIIDGWAVKNVYKDTGPACFIDFYQSYPFRRKSDNKSDILWDSNGALTPPIQIKTERLFGKECIEQPMKLRITIEQIEE